MRVEKLPITTNHFAVYTTLLTINTPTKLPPQPPQGTRIQTKHVTTTAKEAYALLVDNHLRNKAADLKQRIRNWENNQEDSDKAIQEVCQAIKTIATKCFGTKHRKKTNTQEQGTKIRIRNIAKVLRRIETLQLQSRETFKKKKAQKRFETLIARLPQYIKSARAPLNSPQGKIWTNMIRNEKRAKLTKQHTDRKIRKRKKRAKLNPQDEALKAKRRDTHENIASVPQTVNGKTSLTTDPTEVKEAVAAYFQGHLGQRGPKMLPLPEWLQRELSQDRYTGSYTLDKPFT